jgi:abhydrolase domain-containing protein 6
VKRFLKFLLVVFLFGVVIELVAYWRKPEWFLEAEYRRLAWSANVEERSLTAAAHEWRYFDGGPGDAVVLVHGFAGSKENWLPLVPKLDGDFRVVIPDLPGWGESQRRDGDDYRVEAQVERLVAFLDALKLERVRLVGHSMGGHIAGLFAARHPGRVHSLVLVAPAGVHFEPNEFARRVFAGETPFNFATREQFDAFMKELFAEPPWLPPRVKDVLIAQSRARHAFQAALLGAMGREDQAFLLERELGAIRAPTLVAWCDGDRILDVTSLATIEARLPRADDVVLAGCGHMPMMEMPGELADALRPHLAR